MFPPSKLVNNTLTAILLAQSVLVSAFAGTDPQSSFTKLKTLVGTWTLTNPKTSREAAFQISYRLISADTALVEIFGDPAKQVTETVYHMDGDHLMATHYCAQGNQPRLRLNTNPSAPREALTFTFFDATNLKSPNESHLIRLKFEFLDARHLNKTEIYTENGKEDVTTYRLQRLE